MADKEASTKSAQLRTENFYTKKGVLEWLGMVPDGGPAARPAFVPRLLQNVRWQNGELSARGGQELHAETLDPGACVNSMFDMQMATRRSMIVFVFGCPGAATPGLAFSILCFDQEQDPTV